MLEQELNSYWKTVVNTIQDGVMIVDTDGTIVSANNALEKITGYPKEELIGKPCTILNCNICEIARERKGEKWCSLFRTGAVNMRRCALLKKDGGRTHVLKNASLLHDTDGSVMGAVETMTDINELVEKDTQIEAFRRELRTEDGYQGLLGNSGNLDLVYTKGSEPFVNNSPSNFIRLN